MSSYDETEQLSQLTSPRLPPHDKKQPEFDLGGRAEDIAYSYGFIECFLIAPFKKDVGIVVSQQKLNANFTIVKYTIWGG